MKTLGMLTLVVLLVAGCHSESTGGPGATDPRRRAGWGWPDDSFSIEKTRTNIQQGQTQTVSIPITRTKNFDEDVDVEAWCDAARHHGRRGEPAIGHGDRDARVTLHAAEDAALGDFTIPITAHPTRGSDAMTELAVTVVPERRRSDALAASARAVHAPGAGLLHAEDLHVEAWFARLDVGVEDDRLPRVRGVLERALVCPVGDDVAEPGSCAAAAPSASGSRSRT